MTPVRRGVDRLMPAILGILTLGTIALVLIGGRLDRRAERSARQITEQQLPAWVAVDEIGDAVSEMSVSAYHVAHHLETHARLADKRARLDRAIARYEPTIREPRQAEHWQGVKRQLVDLDRRLMARLPDDGLESAALAELEYELPIWTEQSLDALREHGQLITSLAESHGSEVTRTLRHRHALQIAVMSLMIVICAVWLAAARRRDRRERELDLAFTRGLEQANADLNAFAGRIAHDLRSPLTPILAGSQLIAQVTDSNEVRGLSARIERSAHRLVRMIDALLHFSKLGGPPDAHARTRVRPVLDEVLESFTERAERLEARFELEVVDAEVACEPEILASVLQNLVDNALKYGLRDPARPILLRCRECGETVTLEVEDGGEGIDPALAQRIFEPLFQASARASGIGLGLATARRLLEARSGRIELVTAERDRAGALFRVTLPRRVTETPAS